MAVLLELPNETLLNILSRLSQRGIARTARVSRRLHSLSQIQLYRHPHLPYKHGGLPPRLPLLLRTLLTYSENEGVPSTIQSPRLTSTIQSLGLGMYIRSLTLEMDYLESEYETEGTDLVQLLSLLPRLQCLDVSPFWCDEITLLPFIDCIRHPSTLPCALQNIRELCCISQGRDDGVDADTLIHLMALPSLRILKASVSILPEEMNYFSGTAGTSAVTELYILYGGFCHDVLAAILKIPRRLTTFRYDLPQSQFSFHLSDLGRALVPLQASIKHLTLDFSGTMTEAVEDIDDDDGTIGILRQWDSLETLECPLMALFGRGVISTDVDTEPQCVRLVEILPPQLLKLHIISDGYWSTTDAVESVIEMLRCGERNMLQEVTLDLTGIRQQLLDTLIQVCGDAQVRIG